jgi:rhodanese-related sulfurtransferase
MSGFEKDCPMPTGTVTPSVLKKWLGEGSAILLDVREPAEHRATRIIGASLMPLSRLDMGHLPAGKKVVVHCQKGSRGRSACLRMLSKNPDLELYNLEGGIEAWMSSGQPVERAGHVLPLDRQVQLVVGVLLIAIAALSLWVDPAWAWGAGLLGLGLTMAGLTGYCGMALVLARMSWNR